MKQLFYISLGLAAGIILSFFAFRYMAKTYGYPPGFFPEATYFVEVPKEEIEPFISELFKALKGARAAGYIMGTSNMVTIRADGKCGNDRELEAFLTEYVNGNQFVCFMVLRQR